jgi:hypothetical protein
VSWHASIGIASTNGDEIVVRACFEGEKGREELGHGRIELKGLKNSGDI